jgi:leader peptidase (prepilin peptidase)/N-methyltransferase
MNEPLILAAAALAGLIVGTLINALADDLPYTYLLRLPHYADGTPRPFIAWSGLLAFLSGKRAGADGVRLSWRQPLTELATAALFVGVAATSGNVGRTIFLCGCVAVLVLITVIDLEHRMILYAVILPACLYTLVGAALLGSALYERVQFGDYLIGGGLGFVVFGGMYLGGVLFGRVVGALRGAALDEAAFGDGDVLLAALVGFMLGWQALIFALTIAIFAGGVGAVVYLAARLLRRGQYEYFTPLPYGQYIVFGALVMMLWRTPVIAFLQRLG